MSSAIVVDTSAVTAILLGEPDADRFEDAIFSASEAWISAASVIELVLVAAHRAGEAGAHEAEVLVAELGLTVAPVASEHVRHARRAFLRYGKGRHAAGLNYGDCFSYALARERGLPLLFKGCDFSEVDLPAVMA